MQGCWHAYTLSQYQTSDASHALTNQLWQLREMTDWQCAAGHSWGWPISCLWPIAARRDSSITHHVTNPACDSHREIVWINKLCCRSVVIVCCSVVYFSVHRYEYGTFWPNLRQSDYDFIGGHGHGRGYNINVPINQVCLSVCLSVYVCWFITVNVAVCVFYSYLLLFVNFFLSTMIIFVVQFLCCFVWYTY